VVISRYNIDIWPNDYYNGLFVYWRDIFYKRENVIIRNIKYFSCVNKYMYCWWIWIYEIEEKYDSVN